MRKSDYSSETSVHQKEKRVPVLPLYYRSITKSLVNWMVTTLIDESENKNEKTFFLDSGKDKVKPDGLIVGTFNCKVVNQHMDEMHARFTELVDADKKNVADGAPTTDLVEVSLALTLFYDGKINFKRKVDSMWPLICSIIDCNQPSDTAKLGQFLTLLQNNGDNASGERMLAEELDSLRQGMCEIVELPNGQKKSVYLQARCLFEHLDTRALE